MTVMSDPRCGFPQRRGAQAAGDRATLFPALNQRSAFQQGQMFHYGRQRHLRRFRQFADCRLTLRQAAQDGSSGRIG